SAAELAIWTRRRQTTRADIHDALWQTREVVRTSAMRLTLHLIPARDLAVYIAAMRPTARRMLQHWQARLGARPHPVPALVQTIVDSVDERPRTKEELIAYAKKGGMGGWRKWLDPAWSGVRPAVIEGAIFYGPPRGAEATFVRVDRWLGSQA